MIPPVAPDLPACSPASETGSENSVSMAAHTLMILSRAAISRTASTTPLKDNTQQFRTSSRNTTKKRKIEELDERERNSRTSSKSLAHSSIPMKKRKLRKRSCLVHFQQEWTWTNFCYHCIMMSKHWKHIRTLVV